MIAVQRTHELRRDLDWLSGRARRSGRLASVGAWAGAAAGVIGGTIAVPVLELWVFTMPLFGLAAAVASERAKRALSRRYLARLARGEVQLADVDRRAEGELIVVRGTIEASEPLTGTLSNTRGVYRRMTIVAMQRKWIHEAVVDFSLIDDNGERILIQGGGARWLDPSRELESYPSLALDRDGMPPEVRDLVRFNRTALVAATERVLPLGARVQIVGYKTASADVSGEAAGYRLPPQRATLRSGPGLPLVITRVES